MKCKIVNSFVNRNYLCWMEDSCKSFNQESDWIIIDMALTSFNLSKYQEYISSFTTKIWLIKMISSVSYLTLKFWCFILFFSDWYMGYATKNKSQVGIFPKDYIYLKEATIVHSGFVKFLFSLLLVNFHYLTNFL